ncbi:MAG TPA: hypothetical protein VII06_35775 [Chloroflexota bacterium]|jgi:hypothetical protein
MDTLAERAEARLLALIGRYAAGEAEVVRAYFAQEHSHEEHFDVLLRQMGRELQTSQWLHRAVLMNDQLEDTVDRHRFVDFLEQIADEVKHYALLADLAEWVVGRKLTRAEATRYQVYAVYDPALPVEHLQHPELPEATRMVLFIREAHATHGAEFAHAVLRLSEGGGGGAFVAASELSGDEYRERLAAAMKAIVRDEMGHGPGRVRAFVRDWVMDEATLERTEQLLAAYMLQHLRLRNEIWRNPLSEERIAAIGRGEIEAMPLAVPA